jgi:hypothetical protein
VADEIRRTRLLRVTVDLAAAVLRQEDLSLADALALVAGVKRRVLELFPGKEETYDLILKPRFDRILKERYPPIVLDPFSVTH